MGASIIKEVLKIYINLSFYCCSSSFIHHDVFTDKRNLYLKVSVKQLSCQQMIFFLYQNRHYIAIFLLTDANAIKVIDIPHVTVNKIENTRKNKKYTRKT